MKGLKKMDSLLGNEYTIDYKIEKLVNYKISLLDEYVTFNRETLGIDFYRDLHLYLFGGVYEYAGTFRNNINEEDLKKIDNVLNKLSTICTCFKKENYDIVIDILEYLKYYQVFPDGNKRTIYALIKWLKCVHDLPLEIPDYVYEEYDNINRENIKIK